MNTYDVPPQYLRALERAKQKPREDEKKVAEITDGKMTRVLIGIAGQAQAGKDSFGKFVKHRLFERAKLRPKLYAFAEPIKMGLAAIFRWDEDRLDGPLKDMVDPRYGISPRRALQTLGTEWGREMLLPVGPERKGLWVKFAKERYNESLPHGLIVTDVRFENEAQWIRDEGGIIVHLRRVGGTPIKEHEHESELWFDRAPQDYQTAACSSITDLEIEAIRFSEFYLKQRNEGDK